MPLTRLIYFSENQLSPTNGSVVRALSQILSTSNQNNQPRNLTGALIFDELWFLQALEGDRQDVWQTFTRIRDDERHANVMIAEMVETEARIFGNWWMGLSTRNSQTETAFSPFLHAGKFDPRKMAASEMLSLMVALANIGLSRQLANPRAA